MRIALIYPPPWKIPAPGDAPDRLGDGPPEGFKEGDVDSDFFQTPYGLLSLAAQALAAGHQVKVLNLSATPWIQVQRVLGALEADIYGMSCFTANRRGVALVGQSIRKAHPRALIVVGGPHVTVLAKETLEHHGEIDTVVVGEGEATFLELVNRHGDGQATTGVSGTAYREADRVVLAPPRERMTDLDALVSPHEYFDTHLFMTARGCPGRCTFCARGAVWGKAYRAQSVDYVLEALEKALVRLPVKMMMVKDDTFTANRARALGICRGIRERGLNLVWSCDTRADAVNEEVLREMRLAGCQRLSFGVESGSAQILRNIKKKITPQAILDATEKAKKFGIQVRYFMMLGNRGETAATFRESLAFIKRAKPHQYLFACLSFYPGTADFYDMEKLGGLDRELFFREDFLELKMPYDATEADTRVMSDWFDANVGLHEMYAEGVEEYAAILERLGDFHGAHMDLGAAHFRAKDWERAEEHIRRALQLGYPLPGLAHNYLACIAAERSDVDGVQENLRDAWRDPQHAVVVRNVQAVRAWLAEGGQKKGPLPKLIARHDFQLLERTVQPMLPGPIPPDFAEWD